MAGLTIPMAMSGCIISQCKCLYRQPQAWDCLGRAITGIKWPRAWQKAHCFVRVCFSQVSLMHPKCKELSMPGAYTSCAGPLNCTIPPCQHILPQSLQSMTPLSARCAHPFVMASLSHTPTSWNDDCCLQAFTTSTHAQEYNAFHRDMVAHVASCFQQCPADAS